METARTHRVRNPAARRRLSADDVGSVAGREQGAGSREQGAGSREQPAGRREREESGGRWDGDSEERWLRRAVTRLLAKNDSLGRLVSRRVTPSRS